MRATVLITLFLAPLAAADDLVRFPVTTVREHFVCVLPANTLCAADDEEEQELCSVCQRWEKRRAPRTKEVWINLARYRHGRGFGDPRANYFLRDIAEQLYQQPFPKTYAGYPITIDELHAHPERYGWTTLDPLLSKVGSIALDNNVGGLVVADDASAMTAAEVIRLIEVDARGRAELSGDDDIETLSFDAGPSRMMKTGTPTGEERASLNLTLTPGSPMATASMTVESWEDIRWSRTTHSSVMLYPSDENKGVIVPDATGEALNASRKNIVPVSNPGGQQTIIEREEKDRSLYWNAWPEPITVVPSFQAAAHLEPKQKYTLFIDLSGLGYNIVPGRDASRNVTQLAKEWILTMDADFATLTAFVVADPRLFTVDMISHTTPLSIDMRKLRDWFDPKKPQDVPNPVAIFDVDKKPFFTFGRLALPLTTHGEEGIGSVSLSFWDANGRPVDELSIPLCVATKEHAPLLCAATPAISDGFTGTDSIRTATNSGQPTAALHFLDTVTGPVIGIFRRNDIPSDFIYWSTKTKADDLVEKLNGIMNLFPETRTEEGLSDLGKQLFDLLFPDPNANRDPKMQQARDAFEEFLAHHMDRPPSKEGPAPSLFVRVLRDPASMPRVLPFGLLRPPRANPDFLGYHFRIENPLDIQNYDAATTCIARWFLVIPPVSSTELKDARLTFDKRLSKWTTGAELTFQRMRPPKKRPQEKAGTFLGWIGAGTEEHAAALVVMSHHGKKNNFGQLMFGTDDYIASNELGRMFQRPAVAILNGCGTTQPGAEDVMTELNKRNVQAIVATKHTVSTAMAVDFFSCLAESLDTPRAEPSHLGQTYFETVGCLRNRGPETKPPSKKWGARSLAYSLLGNANLKLCSPTKEVRK